MDVKTKKLKHLVLKELASNNPLYENVPVPPNLFGKPYGIFNLVGQLGSGKSTTLVQLLRLYDTTKTFHKIFFYSPSMKDEAKAIYLPECTEIFDTFNLALFKEHIEYIKAEIQEYKIYLHYMEIYNKAKSGRALTQSEIMILEANDYEPLRSQYKHMPTFMMVFDDMQANRLVFSPNLNSKVSNWFFDCRQKNTMCLFSCQSFKCSVPRQLKAQVRVFILFACKSVKYQRDIAEDLVGKVPVETFLKLWDFATKDKYNFFCVDILADENDGMFRQNFDTILSMDDMFKVDE